MKRLLYRVFIILVSLVPISCSEMFEYSPYDIDIVAESLNLNSIDQLIKKSDQEDTLKFALISDPHTFYDDLEDAIKCINKQDGLQFVVCCGDVTDCGLSQEFTWYYDAIKISRYPVVTVVGNHDHRSNGAEIYKRMFGPKNMSFNCMGHNFILFDDVVWENNNNSPDFNWLKNELGNSSDPSIILSHISPWTDQLEGDYSNIFGDIISENNVMLCLHGHEHDFTQKSFMDIPAIVSGSVDKRVLTVIKVFGNEFKIERIHF